MSRDQWPEDTAELPVVKPREDRFSIPGRPIIVAANRLPVTRSPHGWVPSPGGLVRALLPLLRSSGGTWVGWTGEADDVPEPFTLDGVNLHPVLVEPGRGPGLLRGVLQRHAVAAVPRRPA